MAQLSSRGGRFPVGDYVVGKQIGSGSFSTVWHARHRVHGTEVAIKEIVTARLNSKLQDSLKSEIVILKKIDHPNIIRLHDMIEESGKIYIILEYCKGGDLSVYIQKHHGKIPEATAKHFMQQLASGLKVLRENNLIHRDLKPQNLLLFANDDKSILKIADFGFARSLQPRGLAETLCGSPLYMAPEIMQLQKYDAKADLWSVGTILYQLVIGKTPYTGSNQIQLLQNILKTELQFPPDIKDISPSCIDLCQKLLRRNPVERLTFEEFFNHPFLCKRLPDESLRNMTPLRVIDGFPLSQENHATNVDESYQEDCLPENSPNGTPSFIRKVPLRSTYGFSLPSKFDGKEFSNASSKTNITSDYRSASLKPEINESDFRVSKGNTKVIDSLELIDQDYVLVSSPPLDASSMMSASKLSNAQSKSGSPLKNHGSAKNTTTAPMPIFGTSASRVNQFEISEICGSAPGTSAGSMDMIDILEQQPRDSVTRIKNLQRCASTISELVNEKIESSKHLEAFSLQLVILSIWKQAFHICHSASDTDKSQTSHRLKEMNDEKVNHNNPKLLGASETRITQDLCSQIDTSFLLEVGHAEELSNLIEPGNTEMPDAMETIYQCALAFGRRGGVDEYMGNNEGAVKLYSKAVILFQFILLEAPVLMSNPPFLPTDSDRLRLRNYIDILNNRLNFSRSEKMAFVKSQIVDAPAEI